MGKMRRTAEACTRSLVNYDADRAGECTYRIAFDSDSDSLLTSAVLSVSGNRLISALPKGLLCLIPAAVQTRSLGGPKHSAARRITPPRLLD